MKKILLVAVVFLCGQVGAQSAPTTTRLRGTVEKVDAGTLVVKERGGETVSLVLTDKLSISEVLAVDPTMIQSGTFVGTAAVPAADGSLSALEVLVFPEAARGTGEGHSPWDLQPGSTMTNATVSAVTSGAKGKTMTLRYKDGEKTIVVPDGVPIVSLKPGDRSLLVPGAKVIITAQMAGGTQTALRILAGRNGFTPPM